MDRQTHIDEEKDILTTIMSDKPVARVEEHIIGPAKHVLHFDADGEIVRMEIHGYSKVQKDALETVRTSYSAETKGQTEIGEVSYVIVDCTSNSELARGTVQVKLEDATVESIESPSITIVHLSFPLTSEFTLGLAGQKGQGEGFALKATKVNEQTFCWEWFNVESDSRATKLQESGELAIAFAKRGGHEQIVRTEFLSDVSLRISRFGDKAKPEPVWRVNIAKGSWVAWPSLVDGKVVPN